MNDAQKPHDNTVSGLSERLQAGSGSDREIDAAIWVALKKPEYAGDDWVWSDGSVRHKYDSSDMRTPQPSAPPYTRSLDSCRALRESVTPGLDWTASFVQIAKEPYMVTFEKRGKRFQSIFHKDECRAWLIAILRAAVEMGCDDRHPSPAKERQRT